METKDYKYKYMHKHGCGGIAFYFNTEPILDGRILAEESMFPDGTKPSVNGAFKCGNCGKEFYQIVLQHVELNNE